jgi:hypothetical protein
VYARSEALFVCLLAGSLAFSTTLPAVAAQKQKQSDLGTILKAPSVDKSEPMLLQADEMIYDNATATLDKTYAIEEGSVHGGTECTACETLLGLPAGFYGDTFGRTADFMAEWLSARY